MLYSNETELFELSNKLKAKVMKFALEGGGIYRLNSKNATVYEFTPFIKDGVEDFTGGFGYNSKSSHFSFIFDLMTFRFSKNKQNESNN